MYKTLVEILRENFSELQENWDPVLCPFLAQDATGSVYAYNTDCIVCSTSGIWCVPNDHKHDDGFQFEFHEVGVFELSKDWKTSVVKFEDIFENTPFQSSDYDHMTISEVRSLVVSLKKEIAQQERELILKKQQLERVRVLLV